MAEQIKDLVTCTITNGPKGLCLDWQIHQDLDGKEGFRFVGFTFRLDALYEVLALVDTGGFVWKSNDRGKTWTKIQAMKWAP